MTIVRRYDAGQMTAPTYTKEGYLVCDALVTRTGVFKYMQPDGSIRRELRHPEDVYKADSLNTLKGIVLTNDHPWENVSVDTWNNVAVGYNGYDVAPVDPYVQCRRMTVMDKQTIEDITQKRKDQVSCGYDCSIEMIPGEWNGEQYDARQRDIMYNHIAFVPYGRAGDNVKVKLDQIRMDSGDAILAEFIEGQPSEIKKSCGDDATHVFSEKNKSAETKTEDSMKIKIDGLEYEIADVSTAKVIHDAITNRDTEIAKLKADSEGLKGKFDAMETSSKAKDVEIKTLKADAIDEKKAVVIAKARLEVEDVAKAFLGDSVALDDLSIADIKKAVVEKVTDSKMDGKSEAYIDGQFDVYKENMDGAALASLKGAISDSTEGQRKVQDGKPEGKGNRYDAWKSYKGQVPAL